MQILQNCYRIPSLFGSIHVFSLDSAMSVMHNGLLPASHVHCSLQMRIHFLCPRIHCNFVLYHEVQLSQVRFEVFNNEVRSSERFHMVQICMALRRDHFLHKSGVQLHYHMRYMSILFLCIFLPCNGKIPHIHNHPFQE